MEYMREKGWVEGEGWSGTWGGLLMPGYVQYFSLYLLLIRLPPPPASGVFLLPGPQPHLVVPGVGR